VIILRLAGGLGNQIFQIGAALFIAHKHKIGSIIIDDSSLGDYKAARKPDFCQILDLSKSPKKIKIKRNCLTKFRLPRLIPLKLKRLPLITDKNWIYLKENSLNKTVLMDGYFQWVLTQSDFNSIFELLKPLLCFDLQGVNSNNTCIIHIRGKDFVSLGWTKPHHKHFFQKSMQIMKKKSQLMSFVVCTDDKDYAAKLLGNIGYKFSNGDLKEDFKLLTNTPNRIISSSTFAISAVALGHHQNSFVLAQDFWFPSQARKILLPGETNLSL
jgi:hypothetical protein